MRVKPSEDKTNTSSLRFRRLVASLLIYSQFFQIATAAVLPPSPQFPSTASIAGKPLQEAASINAGPLTPLLNYTQTGVLNNLSLGSQQLGLSGPFNWGLTYSDLTGTFFNAQYVLPLGERLALGALGEYGSDQYRINGTLGYGFSPLAQMKFSAERFGQRLPFQFDSGDINSRIHQDAYGIRFQQLFNTAFVQGINAGGYYARADNRRLNSIIFTSNGINCGGYNAGLLCINDRNIAGATSQGADAGVEMLLSPSTLLSGNLYYDQVHYNTLFMPFSGEDRNGFGAGIKIDQLLGRHFKFTGEAAAREIYDSYQAGISWLPNWQKLGMELSLRGQHVISHNATPNNSSISLQLSLLADGNKQYDERHRWGAQRLSDIAQWVQTPAVKMNQVLAIAEQVTRLLAPGITGIAPNSGPFAGGNTVIISGSNFAQGLLVFFGGQLASGIQVLSPTTVKAIVPALTSPANAGFSLKKKAAAVDNEVVDVIVQNLDGQQAAFTAGYSYVDDTFPIIDNLSPIQGSTAGGTVVTITGSRLGTTNSVTFNGTPAVIDQITDTQVTVTTAAHTSGLVSVILATDTGSATRNDAYTYIEAPAVTTQPTNQTTSSGNKATFSAAVSGFPVPTVQWQLSTDGGSTWNDISGATAPNYTTPALSTADNNNQYRAVFTNTAGSVNTNAATLTIADAPLVTTDPASQTASSGSTVSFSAAASGFPTPTAQWQLSTNGGVSWSNISGATTVDYTIPTLSTAYNDNQYRAVFTNTAGSVNTNPATLTIADAPLVTTEPVSQTASSGSTVAFSAAASGFPAPTVQWQLSTNGGVSWSNISGATDLGYTTPVLNMTDNGDQYRAVFTNSAGSVNTNAATLTIANDPIVTTEPVSQTASSGSTVTFSAAASGFPTPTAQWQLSTNGGVSWSNISGATTVNYTIPTLSTAYNDNQYRAIFTNSAGSATTAAATLSIADAPQVTTQPINQTASSGSTASFNAEASGFPTPTVQWRLSTNGGVSWSNISGATAASYTTPTLSTTDNGNQYQAVFTNSAGSATTAAANLTVTAVFLQSISVTPANSSITVGASQQFTATGTYSDNSTQDLTATVLWSMVSPNSAAGINANGVVTGQAPGSATIMATQGSVTGSTGLTVITITPTITAITPSQGPLSGGGTVTITGTNFGTPLNTTVQFGENPITPMSVTATQLTFTVPSRPTAGVVQVRVQTSNGLSNGMNYTYTPSVGDSYLGGIVYEVSGSGGKVVSATNESSQWTDNYSDVLTNSTNGAQNTTNIIASPHCTTITHCAARFCREGPNFNANWYLPAIDEWQAIAASGVLNNTTATYWSSSQGSSTSFALAWNFQNSNENTILKLGSWYVGCVRNF